MRHTIEAMLSSSHVTMILGEKMPTKDGVYYLSFDVPEFYRESVDFSFDYVHCEKDRTDVLGMGIIKLDYPRCSKKRKEIKFDVPRIRWRKVEIPTPFVDRDQANEYFRRALDSLIEEKGKFEENKKEVVKGFEEAIKSAKESGSSATELKRLELMKELEVLSIDEAIAAITDQIEKFGGTSQKQVIDAIDEAK